MAQDGAAVAQVRVRVQQVVARAADFVFPEGHDLHQPTRTGNGYSVAIEVTFDLDDGQDQIGRQPDARGLHVHQFQRLRTFLGIR